MENASAPVLTTETLRLRPFAREDLDASAAMWADPDVVRFIGGRPSSREEAWARILRYRGLWALLGYGYWLIETRQDGRFVGEVGFADFQREMAFPEFAPEAGWALAPWAHGRGWASEAVYAALAWSDQHLPAVRTVCMISPQNTASLRVAEKCGYRPIADSIYKDDPVRLFERLAVSPRR